MRRGPAVESVKTMRAGAIKISRASPIAVDVDRSSSFRPTRICWRIVISRLACWARRCSEKPDPLDIPSCRRVGSTLIGTNHLAPAELLHRPPSIPNFAHVADLIPGEVHHVDVVGVSRLSGGWAWPILARVGA